MVQEFRFFKRKMAADSPNPQSFTKVKREGKKYLFSLRISTLLMLSAFLLEDYSFSSLNSTLQIPYVLIFET